MSVFYDWNHLDITVILAYIGTVFELTSYEYRILLGEIRIKRWCRSFFLKISTSWVRFECVHCKEIIQCTVHPHQIQKPLIMTAVVLSHCHTSFFCAVLHITLQFTKKNIHKQKQQQINQHSHNRKKSNESGQTEQEFTLTRK